MCRLSVVIVKSGGDGEADAGHFGEVCTLAAKKISHLCVAVGFLTEEIDVFIF